jgi:Uma2 family endonuclease
MSALIQTVVPDVEPLIPGDFMSREEFLRRWEAMPTLTRAELIRGVVYMPSPLSLPHGVTDKNVGCWLGVYQAATPGVEAASNATWLMGETEAPQPDTSLYILPEYGGRLKMQGDLAQGAPEFLSETCVTSTSYDLHQKLEVYQEAGVQEYLAVILGRGEIRWHRLVNQRFTVQPGPPDGVYRSAVFPGLWLDAAALLAGDLAKVLAVLQQGISSPEHAAFVRQLAARRQAP